MPTTKRATSWEQSNPDEPTGETTASAHEHKIPNVSAPKLCHTAQRKHASRDHCKPLTLTQITKLRAHEKCEMRMVPAYDSTCCNRATTTSNTTTKRGPKRHHTPLQYGRAYYLTLISATKPSSSTISVPKTSSRYFSGEGSAPWSTPSIASSARSRNSFARGSLI